MKKLLLVTLVCVMFMVGAASARPRYVRPPRVPSVNGSYTYYCPEHGFGAYCIKEKLLAQRMMMVHNGGTHSAGKAYMVQVIATQLD